MIFLRHFAGRVQLRLHSFSSKRRERAYFLDFSETALLAAEVNVGANPSKPAFKSVS
jgi:hypothetical protein